MEVGAKHLEEWDFPRDFWMETVVLTIKNGVLVAETMCFFVVLPLKVEDVSWGKKVDMFFSWEELDPYPSSVSFFMPKAIFFEKSFMI